MQRVAMLINHAFRCHRIFIAFLRPICFNPSLQILIDLPLLFHCLFWNWQIFLMCTNLTTGISHVGLSVRKIKKTAAFFERLGFKRIGGQKSYPSIFLTDGSVMLTIWEVKNSPHVDFDRRTNVGLHHLAIKVPTLDALKKIYCKVKRYPGAKVEFSPRQIENTPLTHMMCFEPCGCRIEFTHHAE